MARLLRATLEASLKDAEAQVNILQIGLQCSLSGEIEWIAKQTIKDGSKYRFGIARLDSPHGGLFFIHFDYPGQKSSFTVDYLDNTLSTCHLNPLSEISRVFTDALNKAVTMRYQKLSA